MKNSIGLSLRVVQNLSFMDMEPETDRQISLPGTGQGWQSFLKYQRSTSVDKHCLMNKSFIFILTDDPLESQVLAMLLSGDINTKQRNEKSQLY